MLDIKYIKHLVHFLLTTIFRGTLRSDKYLASYEKDIIYIHVDVGLHVNLALLLSHFLRTPQYDISIKPVQLFLNCFMWTVGQTETYYENNGGSFLFATFHCECAKYIKTLLMTLQNVKSQLCGTDLPPLRVRQGAGRIDYSVSLWAKPHVSPDLVPRDPVIRSELRPFIIHVCLIRCRGMFSNPRSHLRIIPTAVFCCNLISFRQSIRFDNVSCHDILDISGSYLGRQTVYLDWSSSWNSSVPTYEY